METQRRTVTSKSGAVWAITHELIRPPKSWTRKTFEQRERAAAKLRTPSRKKPVKSKKAAARKGSPTKRKALPKGKPVLLLMARSSVPASAPAEQARKRSKRAGSGQLAMF